MSNNKVNKFIMPNGDEIKIDSGLDSRITNCLLEVPQRIKLELNDGTLTLKAGSQVIVPNGFEADGITPKFDYVDIESDTTVYRDFATGIDVIYVDYNRQIAGWDIGAVHSGSSPKPPSDMYQLWYDTANNLMKATDNGGTTWNTGLSFPVAISNRTINTGFSFIDQIFNGFGYIGSTVWVDKGVKGLIPNGRNEDGTLRNIEFTINNITTVSASDPIKYFGIKLGGSLKAGVYGDWLYDEKTNTVRIENNVYTWMYAGTLTYSNGKITSFNPKLPFRAVDWNDFSNTPHIIDTYVNGTSGYRIWSDGYCEQWGYNGALSVDAHVTISLVKTFANTNYGVSNISVFSGNGNLACRCLISKSTNSFILRQDATADAGCYWKAYGYLASRQY